MEVPLALIIPAVLAEVALVVYVIRQESKTNMNSADILLLKAHAADKEIHHNAAAFKEFEKRIEEKFETMAASIVKIEKYAEDIDNKIDNYLRKQ